MMTITTPADRIACIAYERSFTWRDRRTAGFGFPCDATAFWTRCPRPHTSISTSAPTRPMT